MESEIISSFENKRSELISTIKNLKNQAKIDCKNYNREINIDLKKFLNENKAPEEIKKQKYICGRKKASFKNDYAKKISKLTNELSNLKFAYLDECNKKWKEENSLKIDSLITKNNNRIERLKQKKENIINSIDAKVGQKIDTNKSKTKNIMDEIKSKEENFIKTYSTTQEYYESEKMSIGHFNVISTMKKQMRLLKQENRKILDKSDIKKGLISNRYNTKINSLRSKEEDIKNKNKPCSKFWWKDQILGAVNKNVSKIDQQKHMYAIKTGLVYMMPFTLVAAFFILLDSVILSTSSGGLLYALGVKQTEFITNLQSIGTSINNATLGIMGAALSVTIAAVLGERYGFEKMHCGLIGLSSFILFTPLLAGDMTTSDGKITSGTFVDFDNLGATSMFLAIITALLGVELYRLFQKADWLKIKMPKQVPSAVAKSFNVIIPFLLTSFVFALCSFSLLYFANKNLKDLIEVAVQRPLSGSIESLAGAMTIRIIADGLWVMGIHGQNMIGPVVSPIYVQHLTENANLVAQGKDPIWIVTSTFMDSYTLPMDNIVVVVSLFFFSKRKDHLSIMLVAVIPSLFNISEPILFGLPIVLNPILAVPLILSSQFAAIIAYLATSWHMATPLYIMTPWTTPSIIGPYIASGGDIRTLFVALIVFATGVGTYCPFILLANMDAKKTNPDVIVPRFSIRNKYLFRKQDTISYLKELEENNKIKMKKRGE